MLFYLDNLFLAIHVLVCLLLIGIVLIQGGKGASLSASFGLGGGAGSAFGAQTDSFMVKWTRNIAIIFLVTSFALTYLTKTAGSLTQRTNVAGPQAPAAAPVEMEEPAATEENIGEEVSAEEGVAPVEGTVGEEPSGLEADAAEPVTAP